MAKDDQQRVTLNKDQLQFNLLEKYSRVSAMLLNFLDIIYSIKLYEILCLCVYSFIHIFIQWLFMDCLNNCDVR